MDLGIQHLAITVQFNDLLDFYPITVNLCQRLRLDDLKSLSMVSKEWWEATHLAITKRSWFKIDEQRDFEFLRNYKKVKIHRPYLKCELQKIPQEIETLSMRRLKFNSFKAINRFQKLKNLVLIDCKLPKRLCNSKDLVKGLTSLVLDIERTSIIKGLVKDAAAIEQLIKANYSLRKFECHLKFVNEEIFYNFIQSISLPRLEEFSFFNFHLDCNNGLRIFAENHAGLKMIKLCDYTVNDETIITFLRSCTMIETIFLKGCNEVTGSIIKSINKMRCLKNLKLEYLHIHSNELMQLDLRRFETFEFTSESESISKINLSQFRNWLPSSTNLRVLDLRQYECNTFLLPLTSALPLVSERLPNLIELSLQGINDHSDDKEIPPNIIFKHLIKLDLCFAGLTDTLLSKIYAPKLQVLNVKKSCLKFEGVKHMIDNSPLLRKIFLALNADLEFAALKYTVKNCRNWEYIDTYRFRHRTTKIDDNDLRSFLIEYFKLTEEEQERCFEETTWEGMLDSQLKKCVS